MFVELNRKGIIINYKWYEYIEMVVWLPLLFWLYLKVFNNNDKEKNIPLNILAVCFTLCMLIGYSFYRAGTAILMVSSFINIIVNILKFIGFYSLIKNCLYKLY